MGRGEDRDTGLVIKVEGDGIEVQEIEVMDEDGDDKGTDNPGSNAGHGTICKLVSASLYEMFKYSIVKRQEIETYL